jgi:hypothetical protein
MFTAISTTAPFKPWVKAAFLKVALDGPKDKLRKTSAFIHK